VILLKKRLVIKYKKTALALISEENNKLSDVSNNPIISYNTM